MSRNDWGQTLARIRELVLTGDTAGIPDSALLQLFVAEQNAAAFEAIVRRHGSLVMGVSRRVLQNPSDAEDAFQATFLILVRKAASLSHPDLLDNWLYGVAYRTARTAKEASRRRRAKEGQVIPKQPSPGNPDKHDLLRLLDEELHRLPAKYRAPIVLCDLEQRSRKEVAAVLSLPEGTLASRLARARAMLARRLNRRGVTLTGAALAVVLADSAAATSPALVQTTVKACLLLVTGQAGALSLASSSAFQLSETAMRIMLLSKVKTFAIVIVGSFFLAAGAGALIAQHVRASSSFVNKEAGESSPQKPVEQHQTAGAILDSALASSAEIPDSPEKVKLLLRIANAQLHSGDRPGALAAAGKALAIVQNWPRSRDRIAELVNIAGLQDEAGLKPQSRETAKKALQTYFAQPDRAELDHPRDRPSTLSLTMVVDLLARWGEFEDCLRIASDTPGLTSLIVGSMASQVQRHGDPDISARHALKRGTELVQEHVRRSPFEASSSSSQFVGALQAIAAAYIRLGDRQEAFKINDMLQGIPWKFSSEFMPNALTSIAMEQVKEGKYREALDTVSRIETTPDLKAFNRFVILGGIADRQIEQGDLVGALETAKELSSTQDRARKVHAIALAQFKRGDRAGSLASLAEIRRLAKDRPPPGRKTSDDYTVNGPVPEVLQVDLEARLGDFSDAQKTLSTLTAAKDKAQALYDLGVQYLAANRSDDGRQTLRRASQSAGRISVPSAIKPARRSPDPRNGPSLERSRLRDRSRLLRQIAQQQAGAGDMDGATETLEFLSSQDNLSWLPIARAESGDINGAIDSLSILKNPDDKAAALEQLAAILTRTGDEPRALALANKQETPLLKAYALLGIALEKAKIPGKRTGS